jgi:hypothetical protein
MTPADERILQLLGKWRASLELHLRYAHLSDDEYWLVQPWPRHERPTKWVIGLARQRLEDLERIVQTRLAAGDTSLSEALELMSFLTNLVGAQHIERFVPTAEPEQERPITRLQPNRALDATAEMSAAAGPVAARKERAAAAAAAQAAAGGPAAEPAAEDADVIRDAVRLLRWGRGWHELPEAIARMAGRPSKTRVRAILKSHRSSIEQQAATNTPAH